MACVREARGNQPCNHCCSSGGTERRHLATEGYKRHERGDNRLQHAVEHDDRGIEMLRSHHALSVAGRLQAARRPLTIGQQRGSRDGCTAVVWVWAVAVSHVQQARHCTTRSPTTEARAEVADHLVAPSHQGIVQRAADEDDEGKHTAFIRADSPRRRIVAFPHHCRDDHTARTNGVAAHRPDGARSAGCAIGWGAPSDGMHARLRCAHHSAGHVQTGALSDGAYESHEAYEWRARLTAITRSGSYTRSSGFIESTNAAAPRSETKRYATPTSGPLASPLASSAAA